MSKRTQNKVPDSDRHTHNRGCKFYRTLFENAPVSLWSLDLSRVKKYLDELVHKGVVDYRTYFETNPSEITQCLSRIIVKDVNRRTLELFGAETKEVIVDQYSQIAGGEESALSNIETIIAIADNRTNHQAYSVHWTLDGKKKDILYNWWVLPGSESKYDKVVLAVVDITPIREQELALRLKDHAVQSSIHGIVFLDMNDKVAYTNPAFLKMWGYPQDEIPVGTSILDYWADPDKAAETVYAVRETGRGIGEFAARRKDGFSFDVQFSACAIRDKQGRTISIQMSFIDVSDRKKVERQLIHNEKQYRNLVESMLDSVFIVVDEKIVYANPAGFKLFNVSHAGDLLGHPLLWFLEPEFVESAKSRYEMVCQSGKMQQFREVRAIRRDGTTIDIESSMLPFVYDDNPAVLVIIRDISEDKAIKKQLLEQQEQLRRLVSQLIRAEELQRRRIASELHDHIGQDLILAKMKIDRMSAGQSICPTSLQSISDQLETIVEQVQSLTFDMASPTLFSGGLMEALNDWLDEEVRAKHPLSVYFECSREMTGLPDEIQTFLYRAVKELVVNVIKHAEAHHINIVIEEEAGSISVSVRDDGIGMEAVDRDLNKSKGGGYGLLNMRERIDYMGGSFTVHTAPKQGTAVSFTIPIELNSGQKQ